MTRSVIFIFLFVFSAIDGLAYGEVAGVYGSDGSAICVRSIVDSRMEGLQSMSDARFDYANSLQELGCVWGYYYLSEFYSDGKIVAQDHKTAIILLSKAAVCGDERAFRRLAGYYSFGIHVKKDLRIAYSFYVLAESLGLRGAGFLAKKLGNNMSEKDREVANKNADRLYNLLKISECLRDDALGL